MITRFAIIAVAVAGLAVVVPQLATGLIKTSSDIAGRGRSESRQAAPASQPSARSGSRKVTTAHRRTVVEAGRRGHFLVQASVGGRSLDMMVDTGASSVALTSAAAARLGIRPGKSDFSLPISTANGIIYAAPVRLPVLRIGGVTVRSVEAVVVPGEALKINLLGMSFLGQLSHFEISGDRLILVQ